MKSKIIVSSLIEPENFLFTPEQAGPYIDQPKVQSSGNTGEFRLISRGDFDNNINDFIFHSFATANSATYGEVVDSRLKMFGDEFFIGATVGVGSDVYGPFKVIDFSQSGGTLYVQAPGFYTVSVNVSYTLTASYNNKKFLVHLTSEGDAGDARFKWSPDGGANYFGRNNPNAANWLGVSAVLEMTNGAFPITVTHHMISPIVQAADGDLLVAAYNRTLSFTKLTSSENRGLQFVPNPNDYILYDPAINVTEYNYPIGLLRFKYNRTYKNRIMFYEVNGYGVNKNYYLRALHSDDNGETWNNSGISVPFAVSATYGVTTTRTSQITELPDGKVILPFITSNGSGNGIACLTSYDGLNFTSEIPIYTNDLIIKDSVGITVSDEGRIFCFYTHGGISGISGSTHKLYYIYSDNNFQSVANDTNAIRIGSTVTGSLRHPFGFKDINGDLYVFCEETISGATRPHIVFFRSADSGDTWGSKTVVVSELSTSKGQGCERPYVTLVDGHEIVMSYISASSSPVNYGTTKIIRRGMWEKYSTSTGCPVASGRTEQKLVNDVGIEWLGGNGSIGDSWLFSPKYKYASSNIISDSPNIIWKSVHDSVTCELIIDMGPTRGYFVDGVALFNCNFSSCSVQLNSANTWGSPYESKNISFTLGSGSIEGGISRTVIRTNSTVANRNDHELKGLFCHITSGVSAGYVFRILDNINIGTERNVNDRKYQIFLDADVNLTGALIDGTTFEIYQNSIWVEMPYDVTNNSRYIRIYIPSQGSPDGYYQIGNAILGKITTLDNTWDWSSYDQDHDINVSLLRALGGGMTPVDHGNTKRKFNLTWDKSENSYKQIKSIVNFVRGKNIALIPESSSSTEVYLVKQSGSIKQSFQYGNKWNLSVQFEESV